MYTEHKNADESMKLRCYKLFKVEYGMEPYLIHIKDSKYSTALTRLRLSSHNLAIETGRHAKPKEPVSDMILH